MEIIEKTVLEIVKGKHGKKIWRIIEHPESDLIGLSASCGTPCRSNCLPLGSKYITTLEIPN